MPSLLKDFWENKKLRNLTIIILFLFIISIALFFAVSNNEWRYTKPIAKVMVVKDTKGEIEEDLSGNSEQVTKQLIDAKIMNGAHKGDIVQLENNTSHTGAYDFNLKVGDEVFLFFEEGPNRTLINLEIENLKRDKNLAYIAIVFSFLMVVIGGMKGLRSLLSVILNIVIFGAAVSFYIAGMNINLVFISASVIFVIISVFLVSGLNKKSFSAIIGTFASTIFCMLLFLLVIYLTDGNGMHFENMEFSVGNYKEIFLVEVLIGTLGGIMDLAISISSAVQELKEHNPNITYSELIKSGMSIGKDTMGTMANALLFAYISGSIPMVIMWMVNDISLNTILNYNLSLEIIRALVGSIGVVVSIPVTIVIAARIFHGKTSLEVIES